MPSAATSPPRTYSRATRQALRLLGMAIREARIRRAWTVAELAERTGVSRDLMQRIEQGDPRCGIGPAFEAATLAGVALFEEEPGRLDRRLAAETDRLRLLPKAVRKPVSVTDDDF